MNMRAQLNNVVLHKGHIRMQDRHKLNNHKSGLVWFTGLSASGKSTVAHLVEKELFKQGIRAYVLDGDNIRHALNGDLGFSRNERKENLRRIVEVAKLMVDAGLVVLAAFISPYRKDREYARKSFNGDNFVEIYVKCSLEECERRDPKGQYQKARAGIIENFTGISTPYEEPEYPDLNIDTENTNIETSARMVIALLSKRDFFNLREVEKKGQDMVKK